MKDNNSAAVADFLNLFAFDTVVLCLFLLAVLYLSTTLVRQAAQALGKSMPAYRLPFLQGAAVTNFLLYVFGVFAIIDLVVRPPKELLLAVGGSVAVAIGFALKDFASSVVAGMVLIFDRPFQVGDRVSFADYYGDIELIGLRAVRLRTLTDDVVTIPNSRFLTDAVASGNAGALDMLVSCSLHLNLEADLDLAQRLLREVVVTSRFAFLNKPVTIDISEITQAQGVILKLTAKAFVLDVRYQKAFETDIMVRTTQSFREHKLPRPSRSQPS
jgi:small-conductance mechanosensitive channel